MTTPSEHAIFRCIRGDGTTWLFSVISADEWKITRNGERIDAGCGKRTSMERGVELFLHLTSKVPAGDATNCDLQLAGSLPSGGTVSTDLSVMIGEPGGSS